MLRLVRSAAALLTAGALGVGLSACGGSDAVAVAPLSHSALEAALAAKPTTPLTPAEARIEKAANTLWSGGDDAEATLTKEVARLKGTPVVVNLWGEWCPPCKKEMPIFQRTAIAQRGKVAFLGVATRSPKKETLAYLRDEVALPYPSIMDLDEKVNDTTGVSNIPKTLFFDRNGKRFVHIGPYESEAELVTDIGRYAQ